MPEDILFTEVLTVSYCFVKHFFCIGIRYTLGHLIKNTDEKNLDPCYRMLVRFLRRQG